MEGGLARARAEEVSALTGNAIDSVARSTALTHYGMMDVGYYISTRRSLFEASWESDSSASWQRLDYLTCANMLDILARFTS